MIIPINDAFEKNYFLSLSYDSKVFLTVASVIYSLEKYSDVKINVIFRSFRSCLSTEWNWGLTEITTQKIQRRAWEERGAPKSWEVWGHSSRISSALNFMHYIWYFSRMLGLRCCVPWWDKMRTQTWSNIRNLFKSPHSMRQRQNSKALLFSWGSHFSTLSSHPSL